MPIPRPKILTPVTFDAAQDFVFTVSRASTLDTQLTATVAAGTYYVAWDMQSDDLIYTLLDAMVTAIDDYGAPLDATYYPNIYLDTDNKVVVHFCGSHYVDSAGWENDVQLDLTACDDDLLGALGFDDAADVSSTGTDRPSFTADYQHGYGWYANADGQLASLRVEDGNLVVTPQAVSLSGRVTSQNIGERFTNQLDLAWLDRAQTFSRAVGYAATPVHPYTWNVPLECWWREARLGTEFRVYREGRNSSDAYIDTGQGTTGSAANITDSNKAWATDPQEHKDLAVMCAHSTGSYARFKIASNTATVLAAHNSNPTAVAYCGVGVQYYVLDHLYQTYVVDLSAMSSFIGGEDDDEDYYAISIPLLRYEA